MSYFSIYLPPNSLLVFSSSAYMNYDHGISIPSHNNNNNSNILITENCLNAKQLLLEINSFIMKKYQYKRYSLTFRCVLNVIKQLEEFGPCNEDEKLEIQRRQLWWLKSINDHI